jgi:predicted nuclease of predicted toxin-antitoxin system
MRLLLDTCVWGGNKKYLDDSGHDVVWAGDWPDDPGDEEILRRAHREGRILVTLDKDFGELAIVQGTKHSGIIRLVGMPARQQGVLCAYIVERYGKELESGAIVTVEPGRVRIRPPNRAIEDELSP